MVFDGYILRILSMGVSSSSFGDFSLLCPDAGGFFRSDKYKQEAPTDEYLIQVPKKNLYLHFCRLLHSAFSRYLVDF